jgi:hypothetical protein
MFESSAHFATNPAWLVKKSNQIPKLAAGKGAPLAISQYCRILSKPETGRFYDPSFTE